MAGPNDFYIEVIDGKEVIKNGSLDEPAGVPTVQELALRGEELDSEKATLTAKLALLAEAEADLIRRGNEIAAKEAALADQKAKK